MFDAEGSTQLKNLFVKGSKDSKSLQYINAENLSELQKMILHGLGIKSFNISNANAIVNIVAIGYKGLNDLKLGGISQLFNVRIYTANLKGLNLSGADQLRSLHIINCPNFSDLKLGEDTQSLRHLVIAGTNMKTMDSEKPNFSNLRILGISGFDISINRPFAYYG